MLIASHAPCAWTVLPADPSDAILKVCIAMRAGCLALRLQATGLREPPDSGSVQVGARSHPGHDRVAAAMPHLYPPRLSQMTELYRRACGPFCHASANEHPPRNCNHASMLLSWPSAPQPRAQQSGAGPLLRPSCRADPRPLSCLPPLCARLSGSRSSILRRRPSQDCTAAVTDRAGGQT